MSDEFYDDSLGRNGDSDYSPEEARRNAEKIFLRIIRDGRLPELAFRTMFVTEVVKGVKTSLGGDGILELMCAIDNVAEWETEIIAERADVDNVLLNKYGAFDDDMWEKVKDTLAWTELHRAVYEASRYWIEKAVDEVVNQH